MKVAARQTLRPSSHQNTKTTTRPVTATSKERENSKNLISNRRNLNNDKVSANHTDFIGWNNNFIQTFSMQKYLIFFSLKKNFKIMFFII